MFTVVLGGARSGKSSFAESMGRRHLGPVTVVATCPRIPGDIDLDTRIERHRADRPGDWTTIEEQVDLAGALERVGDEFVIIDCLTLWVNNLIHRGDSEVDVLAATDAALLAIAQRTNATLAISNELGLGIIPDNPVARSYRDVLGRVNQAWAAAADRAVLLVAGKALALPDPAELLR